MNKNSVINLVKDGLEVAIDQVVNSNLAKDIPVVNTVANMLSLGGSVRDALFAKKLMIFIKSLEEVSDEDYKKIKDFSSTKDAELISTKLLNVINAQTDEEKSEIIACIFLAYVDGIMNSNELKRALDIVNAAYIDDLHLFIKEFPMFSERTYWQLEKRGLATLVTSPLFTISNPNNAFNQMKRMDYSDKPQEVKYKETSLGSSFRTAYEHGFKMRAKKG